MHPESDLTALTWAGTYKETSKRSEGGRRARCRGHTLTHTHTHTLTHTHTHTHNSETQTLLTRGKYEDFWSTVKCMKKRMWGSFYWAEPLTSLPLSELELRSVTHTHTHSHTLTHKTCMHTHTHTHTHKAVFSPLFTCLPSFRPRRRRGRHFNCSSEGDGFLSPWRAYNEHFSFWA